jgi:hypothetical protein
MIVGRLLCMAAAVDLMIVGHRLGIQVDLMTEDRLDMAVVEAEDTMIVVLHLGISSVGDMVVVATMMVHMEVIGKEEDHQVRQDVGDTDNRRNGKSKFIYLLSLPLR